MNVLVTGGSGFIGRNIVKILKEEGDTVATLDVKDKNSVADYHIICDVRNHQMVEKALRGIDYVFHMAAVTSPPEFENPMGDGYDVNVLGTYNILAASHANKVKRVVIASSSSIYGSTSVATSEEILPGKYSNFYPLTKRINEMTARIFLDYGVETVALRYFNTYGAGENSKGPYSSVIWKFIDSIRKGEQPMIYGDGKQRRDFIYVRDTARASILAMKKGKPGEVYNVGTGISTDFNTIFQIVREEMKYDGGAKYVPNPLKSYQYFTQADLSKTSKELEFNPEYDIRKGVREMIQSPLHSSSK